MIAPTIHLNGTSASELVDTHEAAARALREALRALEGAAPNARDYYPQGPDAYTQAKWAHCQRVASVRSAYEAICEIHEAIVNAIDARGK